MRTICNQYNIDGEKLYIEHELTTDNYYFRIVDMKTLETRFESEAIAHLIPARAKAFEFMGVQTA